ncbi:hypothetical protein L3Y34_006602 [Caenorhabditis briggsae]|uniref:G-protein coupled receptors family 1 profile domain-containing protein n=1 Tax=Caenorhabditis briggsae TaxID=6238 RepID=A0AAE9CZR4_CAEBR|nr:hypothetical protein L3Y34_006602 [Caenorhabditis briggsae]
MDDAWLLKPMLSLQIFSVIDGLIKIIPTLMFPILTVILVRELKKAADSRKKASVGSEKHEENSKSHQATKLVILMTITYMAAEGPLGIIYVVQGFVTQPPGIVEMTMDLIDIFGVFVSINAIMHCVIYLTVSSQYQKSAKKSATMEGKIDPRNYDDLLKIVSSIKSQIGEQLVDIMIIGFDSLTDLIQNAITLPYSQIKGFPKSKINDNSESLVFGEIDGKNVVCVQGRFDKNEYNMDLALVSVGHLEKPIYICSVRFTAGWSPLNGCGDKRYGSPFVPVHDAYNSDLRKLAIKVGRKCNINLSEGFFTMTGGPQLETSAELRLLRKFGADAVGTSTCHEVTVARHCGVKVLGFAWITNAVENYTEPRYQYGVPEYFLSGLMMSSKLYQYIGGCGKIGLTVILPILTLLLVIEIRKAERNRNNVIASQRTSTKNNQTTKMIFSMTLASMITEGINGILLFWTTAYQDGSYDNISYRRKIFVITSFESMNGILIVLNTMSHFFFALMLSSQYKNTAKNLFICKVLGIPKFTSSRAVSNINMASSTSASTNHGLVKVD